MDLGELTGDGALAGTMVSDLVYSSRDARPGCLFFCVSGFSADGHDFAGAAVEQGAVALVCERPLGLGVPELVVSDVRAAMPALAAKFFGNPSAELRVAGITGTNGKTTVAYLLRQILEACALQCAVIGTVEWVVGGVATPAVRTTPEAIDLQRAMRAMLAAGDEVLAIEVSSHALELGRADAVQFALAVFTNLSQDHLDFHPSLEAYFAAKRKLFESATGPCIVNIDDPYGRQLAADFSAVTYSAAGAEADFRATGIAFDARGTSFTLHAPDGEHAVTMQLPGAYNVANALAAVASAVSLGVGTGATCAALADCKGAPGRFELVEGAEDFTVVVDYAHTPDSVDSVLAAAAALPHTRLIGVLGAGGDRDRSKRPLMGAAAARHCDLLYITSDNPRSEDPATIVAAVRAGADEVAAGRDVEVFSEVDRQLAIEAAVGAAGAGDIIVIAGKGHEQGQEFADGKKLPFDDVAVARGALGKRVGRG
ncbi:MAG: UDP-N-acetylmuramoyl-L-alanyl-D-glutamate--2,6-diaminopimelate ligase [Thermoleophilaceae bacterium]|nr:UDP-N-acetylmuramoyl-L-alanyl-D-glutamate--2,6-diaminopimelate ligase [Thermoleophilaceae bacterium]